MNDVDKLVARLGWQCVQLDMALQQVNQQLADARKEINELKDKLNEQKPTPVPEDAEALDDSDY